MKLFCRIAAPLVLLSLLAGCASTARFPDNPPISQAGRLQTPDPGNGSHNQVLLSLTFSGGGSRAAAFAYGVLRELQQTPLEASSQRRLSDEIDMISAVSGGSVTAAYYGLFGDSLFQRFLPDFLEQDVEAEFKSRLLGNLGRLSSPSYGRGDLLAEYLDEKLFQGAPLSRLIDGIGPFVEINATDLFKGGRFGFTPEQFAVICSDPSGFKAARAVAASSAVPLIFAPITLINHSGRCDYQPPAWLSQGLREKGVNNRRYRMAQQLAAYLDRERHPYLHLLDGGLSDNLGLRTVMDRIIQEGGIWPTLQRFRQQSAKQIVLIMVNAAASTPSKWEQSAEIPPNSAIIDAATSAPLNNYNFETLEYLREHRDAWAAEVAAGQCSGRPDCQPPRLYFIEVNLEDEPDPALRNTLTAVPTGFTLQPGVAQQLIDSGARVLGDNPEYQALLQSLLRDNASE